MRIVHVAPFYTPIIGGVEEVARKIAEYTTSRGYETYVVTYNRFRNVGIGSLPREEEINGVHVIRLKPDFTWSNGTYSSELPQVIKGLKPDIVHVHVWRHSHVFQVARLRRELKFKAVLHGHAPFYNLSQSGLVTWIYYRLVDTFGRDYLKAYDIYIALTPYEVDKVKALGLSDNVVIIPNGIYEDKCSYSNAGRKDNIVLYLGRISKSKNIDLLIKAIKYVNNIELIVVGPDEGLVRKYVRYAKRSNMKIRYIGQVSEIEKHRLYLESMVYTLPSLYEGFGLTLLEAGIHGTPSVITGEGGQVYAAPPNKASLWAGSNPRSYAEAIGVLLTDKGLWVKLGQGAREWAQMHVWGRILPRYDELYSELTR